MNTMNREEFRTSLAALKGQLVPLELFADLAAASVYGPIFCDSDGPDRYFRYPSPNVRHFCILKFARVVSSLNASLELARTGFNQEICILIRTMIESASLIEWALESLDASATHKQKVEAHVSAFFSDGDRGPGSIHKPHGVKQEDIHKAIAKIMDQRLAAIGLKSGKPTKDLMSQTFLTYSYYVHARYPELMDMFGGTPARLHTSGMLNTPKDRENLDMLSTFIRTANLTAWHMSIALNLMPMVSKHPVLSKWRDDLVGEQDD